jgi:catechol 2,3-dioxygenase-like lactoylglutathione lyase family enzyme
MSAKMNHLAIISEQYERSAKFYETIFGMRSSGSRSMAGKAPTAREKRPAFAATVGDGYVGLNINPRRPGRAARFEHFGIQVDDAEAIFGRMAQKYPRVKWLKRPSNRPFAGITTHDPDGNVFDISQNEMANRKDIYAEEHALHPRHISHFAIRTMNPDTIAEFYRTIFDFELRNKQEGDPNHYLSDGHITLVVMPWDITDYDGTGIAPASMDHVGFTVENLADFKDYVKMIGDENPFLQPMPLGANGEGRRRLALWQRSCPLCQHHMTDMEGNMISASVA